MNTDNDKLIAEFMGLRLNLPDWETQCESPIRKDRSFENISFSYDWNWLMSVVDKIESLGYDSQIVSFDGESQTMFFDCFYKPSKSDSKIVSVYNGCVEFIKWYNQQSK